MIRYVNRQELDIKKYNDCIENAIQSRVYAYSWYLDIVSTNWAVLILNDYEAVMPIPLKSKLGFTYVHQPFWTLELGVFSKENSIDYSIFLEALTSKFSYINLRLNSQNNFLFTKTIFQKREFQLLNLDKEYSSLEANFRSDRKKDIKKCVTAKFTEEWNTDANCLLNLFKENIAHKTPYIKDKDYTTLLKLMDTCIQKNKGELCVIRDNSGKAIASGFYVIHNNSVTLLVSASDFKNKKSGVNTYLIVSGLKRYLEKAKVFNFGGSSIESIANYFKSFNAETISYYQIHQNKLPKLTRWLR